jgi:hypothetical protein
VIVLRLAEWEAMEMGMENSLPEDAMFPEHYRGIKVIKKLLHLALQGKEFRIKFSGHTTITFVMMLWNDKQMALDQWGVIGSYEKIGGLFENISNIATLTKCAVRTICFSIQGDMAPILHADCSF